MIIIITGYIDVVTRFFLTNLINFLSYSQFTWSDIFLDYIVIYDAKLEPNSDMLENNLSKNLEMTILS
jgi:hypothetical protein